MIINYGCGKAHIFAAENAKNMKEPDSGDLEDMEIVLLSNRKLRLMLFAPIKVVALSAMAAIALAANSFLDADKRRS